MYFFMKGPVYKCSNCNSKNVARTLNNNQFKPTKLVCLDCGHKSVDPLEKPIRDFEERTMWIHSGDNVDEITF